MAAEDVKTNAKVRRVFAQNWIDVTHISHRTVRGHVHVAGRIITVGGSDPDGTPALMQRLHDSLLAVSGVEDVEYNLDNWMFDGVGWKLVGAAKARAQREEEKIRARREAHRKAAAGEAVETPEEQPTGDDDKADEVEEEDKD
jgi:hypothetical protein